MESGRAGQSTSLESCKGCGAAFADSELRWTRSEDGPYHERCLPLTETAALIQEAEEWLEKMKEHTDCCGTPIVRRLVAALKS